MDTQWHLNHLHFKEITNISKCRKLFFQKLVFEDKNEYYGVLYIGKLVISISNLVF